MFFFFSFLVGFFGTVMYSFRLECHRGVCFLFFLEDFSEYRRIRREERRVGG